jgi:hypothetical protein
MPPGLLIFWVKFLQNAGILALGTAYESPIAFGGFQRSEHRGNARLNRDLASDCGRAIHALSSSRALRAPPLQFATWNRVTGQNPR